MSGKLVGVPCSGCPFRRTYDGLLPASARAHAEAVIAGGAAYCHETAEHCVGAAMFRANVRDRGRHAAVADSVQEFVKEASPPAIDLMAALVKSLKESR